MKKYIFIIIISLFGFSNLQSQFPVFEEDVSKTFSTDTVCVRYQFYPQDTLIYQINAFDSSAVNYDKPLLRNRKEVVMFVCDSVDSDKKYHISRYLLEYNALESNKELQNAKVESHPFVTKKVSFVIDENGKRYSYHTSDSTTAIVAPGGPFTPHLFFDLGIYCNQIDINWNVKSNDEIPETGVPFPLFNNMTLFKFRESLDTLNREVNRLEFIRTGQASYDFPNNGVKSTITAKTNEFGLLDISKNEEIPIHYYSTKEVKVSINNKSGRVLPGYNYYTQYFTLIKFSSPRRIEMLKELSK